MTGKFPAFERRNGLTIVLRNPAATLTFTPETRECAGATFVGFHIQFKAERGPIIETASWELGGTARGLSYFDGYRGWHAPPQWMRADAVPATNPKLMPSLLQGTGFQFEHGPAGALDTGFHDYFRDRVIDVVRRFGLDGLWLDTHLSYAQQARPPDHAARLAQMYGDFARAGARHLLVEGDRDPIGVSFLGPLTRQLNAAAIITFGACQDEGINLDADR